MNLELHTMDTELPKLRWLVKYIETLYPYQTIITRETKQVLQYHDGQEWKDVPTIVDPDAAAFEATKVWL